MNQFPKSLITFIHAIAVTVLISAFGTSLKGMEISRQLHPVPSEGELLTTQYIIQ